MATPHLTNPQRTGLDDRVHQALCTGLHTKAEIFELLVEWIGKALPERADQTEYIDDALKRLKHAGRVREANGYVGWVAL